MTVDINVGLEFVKAAVKRHDLGLNEIRDNHQELEQLGVVADQLQILLGIIGQAKSNEGANFSDNPQFINAIKAIHEVDPTAIQRLFGHVDGDDYDFRTPEELATFYQKAGTFVFQKKEDLETLWTMGNTEMRRTGSQEEKLLMKINRQFDDLSSLIKIAAEGVRTDSNSKKRMTDNQHAR